MMLQEITCVVLLASSAICRPADEKDAKILKFESKKDEGNQYRFAYDTSNGITQSEQGQLVQGAEGKEEHMEVQGFYSYIAPNNLRLIVRYTAGEDGFRPTIIKQEGGDVENSKVSDVVNEFPDNIGSALLATLSGG